MTLFDGGGGGGGWGRSMYLVFPGNCSVSYLSFVYGRSLRAELNGGENSLHWKANMLPLFSIMTLWSHQSTVQNQRVYWQLKNNVAIKFCFIKLHMMRPMLEEVTILWTFVKYSSYTIFLLCKGLKWYLGYGVPPYTNYHFIEIIVYLNLSFNFSFVKNSIYPPIHRL